jgi:hypothetical protein
MVMLSEFPLKRPSGIPNACREGLKPIRSRHAVLCEVKEVNRGALCKPDPRLTGASIHITGVTNGEACHCPDALSRLTPSAASGKGSLGYLQQRKGHARKLFEGGVMFLRA